MNKTSSIKERSFKKKIREILFRIFFSFDFRKEDIFNIAQEYINLKKIPENIKNDITDILTFYVKNKEIIDEIIKSHLEKWTFDRLGSVERAVLRLGVTELLMIHDKNINQDEKTRKIKRLIIDILDIVDCYTDSKNSIKFVNGVIGKINREIEKNEDSIYIRYS